MKQKVRKPSAVDLFQDLRVRAGELEEAPYFDLSDDTRRLITDFNKVSPRPIKGWSFIPHPEVVEAFTRASPLRRFILTIDAVRNRIFDPVEKFLREQPANIRSYYAGGWSDFVCDVQLTKDQFEDFLAELEGVLVTAGIMDFLLTVKEAISVFEVTDAIIVCRQPLARLQRPRIATINALLKSLTRFEAVFRNYQSSAALAAFDGHKRELKKYVRELRTSGTAICFRPIWDVAHFGTMDYVPTVLESQRAAPIDKLLRTADTKPELLKPVNELLKVQAYADTSSAEQEVNYFFINDYDYPGERLRWKLAVYAHNPTIGINLYNYPIDEVLCDGHVSLSDLPETLAAIKQYSEGALLGWLAHDQVDADAYALRLPFAGLSQSGVTLGDPGFGKTNADMVLASEVMLSIPSVIILDGTKSIDEKLNVLPAHAKAKLLRVRVPSDKGLATDVASVLATPGFWVVEYDSAEAPAVFREFLRQIQVTTAGAADNIDRRLDRLLLVEEAVQVLGKSAPEKRQMLGALQEFATLAWRKGCCLWLSAHYLSEFDTPDFSAETLLTAFKNRVILHISHGADLDRLLRFAEDEGCTPRDVERLRDAIPKLGKGFALTRGITVNSDGTSTPLPYIRTRISFLQKV